jgi:imidazoleglycerol-phosphate dehydratase
MQSTPVRASRTTRETEIEVTLDLQPSERLLIDTGVPFFDHMLHAMAFHGGFTLHVGAKGDLEVDAHHTVEDVGLVLGDAFRQLSAQERPRARYGFAVIPMDDALSEAAVDASGRPYLVYHAELPQPWIGSFDVSLVREFLQGLAVRAGINLHARCRYGENSHHMIEALFKALGKALAAAYAPTDETSVRSTKGTL